MMKFLRILLLALRALKRNPMRAGLTTLGIIIGVSAVIAMMEIGSGVSAEIQSTISNMGANVIMIWPGQAANAGVSFGAGTAVTLTPQDCDAILRDCPAVRWASPVVGARAQLVYGHTNYVPWQINGVTPQYLEAQNWLPLQEGDVFTDQDVRNASKVCLVGQTIVNELFDGQDPVGKEMRIRNVAFKVIGVLKAKGANMMGFDQDDVVLAPWTSIKFRVTGSMLTNANQSAASSVSTSVNTLSNLYPESSIVLYPQPSAVQAADRPQAIRFINVNNITVSAWTSDQIPTAIREVTQVLRERHHIRAGQDNDFNIRDMTQMVTMLSSTSTLMTKLLLVVALISLIVGGVGIMNIMLVSVTERTREIGLRMAVGARGRDILRQFLVEAIVLCLAGGVLGIALGRSISLFIRYVLHWPVQASVLAAVVAVVVSASVGIIFGFYPAWKASRLDPIEALRYE